VGRFGVFSDVLEQDSDYLAVLDFIRIAKQRGYLLSAYVS
jgi:hypothetical protein